jgi:polyferredoxin
MLTSTLIGLIAMVLWRPRTWCSFCPVGSMTQLICKAKQRGKQPPAA